MKRNLTARLFRNRFQSEGQVRQVLEAEQRRQPKPKRFIKAVHNGNFFRVKVPGPTTPFRLPKLRNHANPMMRPFVQTQQQGSAAIMESGGLALEHAADPQVLQNYWQRLRKWLRLNAGVLILNFGSVCSLLAFTRSDVLELRSLSVTGSLCSLVYFGTLPLEQRTWTPILWGFCFLFVNGFKIRDILEERQAVVEFANQHQEDIYRNHFLPHGITLKQFEYIMKRARTIRLNKGDVLVREGTPLKRIFLVTSGKTRAHHLGRRLTAVSYAPTTEFHAAQQGGASGAWVGEMAFLEHYWHKQPCHAPAAAEKSGRRRETTRPVERAMYTISAVEDETTVLAWKHDDMEALLEKSGDLRASLTRAMTAAIVGKVVAFTASKKAAYSPKPSSSWLGGLWQPQSHKTVPQIGWIEEEEDEEDVPKKVRIERKPTFALPETG